MTTANARGGRREVNVRKIPIGWEKTAERVVRSVKAWWK
jgi:hypothetical protein